MSDEILRTILLTVSVLALPALLAGAVLLALALRGRRIDDHPVCRKCAFDLVGIAGPAAATSQARVTCPECGTDVSSPGRLRIGNRVRRPRMLAASAGLIVFALTAAIGLVQAMGSAAWTSLLPSWALVLQTSSSDQQRQRTALTELTDRITSAKIAGWVAGWASRRALEVQGDPQQPWLTEWGDLIEASWHAKSVSVEQYRQYLQSGVTYSCRRSPWGTWDNDDIDQPLNAAAESIDITPILTFVGERLGLTTSIEVRVGLIDVVYGTQRLEGDGNEEETVWLGPGSRVMGPATIKAMHEAIAPTRATAKFHIFIRGTERDDQDSARKAAIDADAEFLYDLTKQDGNSDP